MNAASAEEIDEVMRSSVPTTVDELVRQGGTVGGIVASRVAALGAAGGGTDLSGDAPVKTKDGDVILSAQVYCFDAVVGFFRSGKVSFVGALTPGSFSAKVQVVVRGADALRTGDVVRVYGQVGISWKGKPSVFARHLVTLSSPSSSSSSSSAAAAARAAPPSELPPRLPFGGEAEGAEFVFSKGADEPPIPPALAADARRLRPHPSWPALPKGVSGLCCFAARGVGAAAEAAASAAVATTVDATFVALCDSAALRAEAEEEADASGPATVAPLCRFPSMRCTAALVTLRLRSGAHSLCDPPTQACPAPRLNVERFCRRFGVVGFAAASEAAGGGRRKQAAAASVAAASAAPKASYALRRGGQEAAVHADPKVLARFYGVSRPFAHLVRVDVEEAASMGECRRRSAVAGTVPEALRRILPALQGPAEPAPDAAAAAAAAGLQGDGGGLLGFLFAGTPPSDVFSDGKTALLDNLVGALRGDTVGDAPGGRVDAAAGVADAEEGSAGATLLNSATPPALFLHDVAKKVLAHHERVVRAEAANHFASPDAPPPPPVSVALPTLCDALDRKRLGSYVLWLRREAEAEGVEGVDGAASPPPPAASDTGAAWAALDGFVSEHAVLLRERFGLHVSLSLPCGNPSHHAPGCPCLRFLQVSPQLMRAEDAAADSAVHPALTKVRRGLEDVLRRRAERWAPAPVPAPASPAVVVFPGVCPSGVGSDAEGVAVAADDLLVTVRDAGRLHGLAQYELEEGLPRLGCGGGGGGGGGGGSGAFSKLGRGLFHCCAARAGVGAAAVAGGVRPRFTTSLRYISRPVAVLRDSGCATVEVLTRVREALAGNGGFAVRYDHAHDEAVAEAASAEGDGGGGGGASAALRTAYPFQEFPGFADVVRSAAIVFGQGATSAAAPTRTILITHTASAVVVSELLWDVEDAREEAVAAAAAAGAGPQSSCDAVRFSRLCEYESLWRLKPFGFSGSMEGRVAALIVHAAMLELRKSGRGSDGSPVTVVDACCGSGGLAGAAAYVFGCRVLACELRKDFAERAMLNFEHLGVGAVLDDGSAGTGAGADAAQVLLAVHDAGKPLPFPAEAAAAVQLVVANPPWGVRFGGRFDSVPILANLARQFRGAVLCFVAPHEALAELAAQVPEVHVLRRLPFGCVQILLAQWRDPAAL